MGTQSSKSPQKHRKDRSRNNSTSPEVATQSSSSSSFATGSGAAANRNYLHVASAAAAHGPSTSSQEESDAAFARRLAFEEQEELRAEHAQQRQAFGLGSPHRQAAQAEMHTARAACPMCGAMNEFSAALGSQPVMMQCGSCSGQFQVAMPSAETPSSPSSPSGAAASSAGSGRQSLQLCRRCGTMNQFPAPAVGQPMPDVLCGFCGSITPANTRRRAGGQRTNEARLIEQMLLESQGRGRPAAGPMVRVNVGGQRRMVPLALLLALMAEEADKSNPAYHADIASLPTRKLAGGESLNLGEQMRCVVCLDDFGDGDDLKTLPCLHIFHQKCIEQWLRTDNSCPICKTPIGHLARGS